jgi:hypothetical protein
MYGKGEFPTHRRPSESHSPGKADSSYIAHMYVMPQVQQKKMKKPPGREQKEQKAGTVTVEKLVLNYYRALSSQTHQRGESIKKRDAGRHEGSRSFLLEGGSSGFSRLDEPRKSTVCEHPGCRAASFPNFSEIFRSNLLAKAQRMPGTEDARRPGYGVRALCTRFPEYLETSQRNARDRNEL